jgi:hypothetical protein
MKNSTDSAMGRRPVMAVKEKNFLRFADEKLQIELLCTLYSDWFVDFTYAVLRTRTLTETDKDERAPAYYYTVCLHIL